MTTTGTRKQVALPDSHSQHWSCQTCCQLPLLQRLVVRLGSFLLALFFSTAMKFQREEMQTDIVASLGLYLHCTQRVKTGAKILCYPNLSGTQAQRHGPTGPALRNGRANNCLRSYFSTPLMCAVSLWETTQIPGKLAR